MSNKLKRIDPHVHFRDEEQNYKETIKHGLEIAKDQGVEIVFDMPNTYNPILNEKDVIRRLSLVNKDSKNRYFLYVGATSDEKQLIDAINLVKKYREVIGLKLFAGKSTGNLAVISEKEQKKVYKILAKNNYKGVLAVHCEKEEFIKNDFKPENPISHALSRPKKAEIESIKDQIKFIEETKFEGIIHICHISCKDSVKLVNQAKKDISITCGVTPHHLLYDNRKMKESNGLLYKMNPPLRSKSDVRYLQKALKKGFIDWIETDHAPHSIGEKLFKDYPSGFPSLYLYKYLVEDFLPSKGINNKQIKDLTYNNIVKVFNLNL